MVFVVSILIPHSISQVLHAFYRSVSDVQRNGWVFAGSNEFAHSVISQRDLVGLGGECQVHSAFSERQRALGKPDVAARLVAGGGQQELKIPHVVVRNFFVFEFL